MVEEVAATYDDALGKVARGLHHDAPDAPPPMLHAVWSGRRRTTKRLWRR